MLTLLIVYVYQKRRITPKIQMSASLEKMFVPYSVEELEKMESPYVEEIREWTESKRVLDDGELGLETTTSGHRIIRIGNGSTEFMSLPVAFDIEEVREINTGMDKDAKTYYDDMVKKGTELLAEMKALATTVELEDDATQIKYRMGISNGTLYFEEITKEASE